MKQPSYLTLVRRYVLGFTLALFTTVLAFLIVKVFIDSSGEAFSSTLVITTIVLLALLQLLIQLVFFLHLGRSEEKPRLHTMSFLFMTMVVIIIGFGSIWVMRNLDYNMMPHDPVRHMEKEENINSGNQHTGPSMAH